MLSQDLNALETVFQITMGSGNPATNSKLQNVIQRQIYTKCGYSLKQEHKMVSSLMHIH